MLVGTLPVKVRFVDDSAFDKQIPNILCGNILDTLHLEIVINLYKSKKIGQRESLRIQQVLREPDNATDKTDTWKSEDPTVATVDSNGKVTVVTPVNGAEGAITCTANDGSGVSATCWVTVTPILPESISLPSTMTVAAGQTVALTPTITPADAVTTLTWKSDDEAIVRVNGSGALTGLLTGVAEGLAIVTVSTSNGLTSNACKVKVEPDPSGINDVQMAESNNAPVFTLSGQRLAAPKKGINIIGGKKMVVK